VAFPSRSLEAIKGLRRNPEYRSLVNEIPAEVQGHGSSSRASQGVAGVGLYVPSNDLPTDREGAIGELAKVCIRDASALCLSTEEVEEILA